MSTPKNTQNEPCHRCRGSGLEPDLRAWGRSIREARQKKGLGLRELARMVDVSPAYVSDLEHGRRGGGLGPATVRLLKALGIPIKAKS